MLLDGRVFGISFSLSHRNSYAAEGLDRLHGHTYGLAVELKGEHGAEGRLIFPLEELLKIVKDLCGRLNNKVLLASGGDNVYKEDSIMMEYISSDEKRYILPMGDVELLPIEEVTAEALASWIGTEIAARVREHRDFHDNIEEIEITLFEGQERSCVTTIQLT